jgi:choline dehydrogenase-like flavoprotein
MEQRPKQKQRGRRRRRGRRPSDYQPLSVSERRERQEWQRERARALFGKCLEGETFGSHAGQVALRIEARLYDAARANYRIVPGWRLRMLVGGLEEIMEAQVVCERALELWTKGGWDPVAGQFRCERVGQGDGGEGVL